MSYQETKLQAIADAIREKDGTSDPIPANDFPARIKAIPTGLLPEDIRTISLVSANSALGKVTGSGKASDGMIVTAKSLAADGYKTQNWTEDGKIVSQEAEYRFTVEKDISWTETSVPTNENRQRVAYRNGKYIAVSYDDRNTAIVSTDGITWKQTALPDTARWRAITYGAGKFVIVTHTNNIVAYSEDGENWETTTLPVTKAWQSVTFGNETFVAVGTGIDCAYSK